MWASLSCGIRSPLAKTSSNASQLSKTPSLPSPLAKTSSFSFSISQGSPLASPLARTSSSLASPELRQNSLRTSSSGLTPVSSRPSFSASPLRVLASGRISLRKEEDYLGNWRWRMFSSITHVKTPRPCVGLDGTSQALG